MKRKWLDVNEARELPGLRLVLTKGVPNPWAEGAKALFHVKGIPWVPVTQRVMGENAELQDWTGQTSAPVAVYEREKPRTTWSEILLLAERLGPEPSLIPEDPTARARMFGYLHELCGEMGLGYCRRLNFTHRVLSDESSPLRPVAQYIGGRYGYGRTDPAVIERRMVELLAMFAGVLREQYARGTRFFIGDRLTALDTYWATFMALIEPLPPEVCETFPETRALYTLTDPELRARVDPVLLEHRDRIYRDHLELPLVLR